MKNGLIQLHGRSDWENGKKGEGIKKYKLVVTE